MNLLLITNEFPPGPGGVGTHACQIARHLNHLGWRVTVLAGQPYASKREIDLFNKDESYEIRTITQSQSLVIKFLSRFKAALSSIKETSPDLLLATGDRDIIFTALLSCFVRIPFVAVEHGRTPSSIEKRLKKWAYRRALTVICVSNYTCSKLKNSGIDPISTHIIPNGADHTQFRRLTEREQATFKEEFSVGSSKILLTVGNVTHRKGQETVIRALPYVLGKHPDTHYFLAGLPTEKERLRELAKSLGVDTNVHFLGKVNERDLLGLFNICDLFLMTSRNTEKEFEGYGIAAVEAALCGKPAIVSNNSGLEEAVVDSQTGYVVNENDEISTAEKISILLSNEELREQLGKNAYERATSEQTWEKRVKQYDIILRSLINLHPLPLATNRRQSNV
jgi:phosphatidyl-myo-inositol dimannoside synthase